MTAHVAVSVLFTPYFLPPPVVGSVVRHRLDNLQQKLAGDTLTPFTNSIVVRESGK